MLLQVYASIESSNLMIRSRQVRRVMLTMQRISTIGMLGCVDGRAG